MPIRAPTIDETDRGHDGFALLRQICSSYTLIKFLVRIVLTAYIAKSGRVQCEIATFKEECLAFRFEITNVLQFSPIRINFVPYSCLRADYGIIHTQPLARDRL